MYVAAALFTSAATAVTAAVPLTPEPASGLAARPHAQEPVRPYIVTARDRAAARALVREMRWGVRRSYTAALPGFATSLTAAEEAELRADPRVTALEPDRAVHPLPARRVRARARAVTGAGVTVYVVSSGLRATGERAWRAFDATGGTGQDCTGHGTRTARAVSAAAPRARLASVRALGCDGHGSLSDVLAALDWVRRHARKPAVAAVPLGGAGSPALALAARRLTGSGVLVVRAARRGTCRVGPGGQAYSAAVPRLAGAAARHLERDPGASPAALASRLGCGPARNPIRQKASRTSNLLLRTGEL